MTGIGSAESINGWSQLYLRLSLWPDRIRDAVNGPHRERDELEFYLCFFVQAFSLRDWLIQHGAVGKAEIDLAIDSYVEMRICRDICNRYKHLNIRNPSIDAKWSIRRIYDEREGHRWVVIFDQEVVGLWDLMVRCLSFWEALVASYGLETSEEWFTR